MIYYIGESRLFEGTMFEHGTLEQLVGWISDLKEFEVDTETTGEFNFVNKILTLQIGNPYTQFVINVPYVGNRIQVLRPFFEDPSITKILQNAKFDLKFLKQEFGWDCENIYDTLLAEAILTTGMKDRKLSLEHLAMKYCGKKLNKEVRGKINRVGLTDEVILYAAEDVSYLTLIKEAQLKQIGALELDNVLQLENEAVLTYTDIEYNGIVLNVNKWASLARQAEDTSAILELELDKMVEEEPRLSKFVSKYVQGDLFGGYERSVTIKWSSPTQIFEVFRTLGLPIETTSEKEINKYQNQEPLVKKFIDYKKQAKLASTYGLEFLENVNKVTGRVHTNFWQILETGRISSNEPNMQQIPANNDYRNCFTVPEGKTIVSCDFSGQELRIIAEGSQDPVWLTAFREGRDLHSEVASMVFDVEVAKVKEKPDFLRGKSYRDIAKTINFGLAYGMSEFKLANTLSIPVEDAKKMIDKYFKALPKVKEFLTMLGELGKARGYIRTFQPYRRIRWFSQWEEAVRYKDKKVLGEIERASKNTPIQGGGADMCKLALVNLKRVIKEHNYPVKIIMTVHDQIDCEVPIDFAEEWSLIQKKVMEDAGKVIVKTIPVLSEITISREWSK